jgi:hypothetical protein
MAILHFQPPALSQDGVNVVTQFVAQVTSPQVMMVVVD